MRRFGPISRKGITSIRNKPSQSQAVIDDQAHATPVVSNSKHMSRPAPSLPTAFLQQTNGNKTILLERCYKHRYF